MGRFRVSVWLWPVPVIAAVAVAGRYGLVAGLAVAGVVVVLLGAVAGAEVVIRRMRERRTAEPAAGTRGTEPPARPRSSDGGPEPGPSALSLRDATLRHALLSGADLRGAVLAGADLRYADLRGADLEGADLEGADLRGVNTTPPAE